MPSSNNKRIAKNTLMLYFRMILTMLVSLYTSRVVLNTLGVEDYGIYSVVGGVVLMFSIINSTMASAVQRFMNFEMGKNNNEKLKTIFNTSVIIHIGIALIVLVLLESIGVWFLNNKMNISPERMDAANWVLQFSIFSFIATILSVPYNAAIIANEKMEAFAFISILEVSLKLLIVFSLDWFGFDKLKLYAVLMFLLSVLLRLVYGLYAKKQFKECVFHWQWDKSLFQEMTAFSGWNMIGVSSTVIRTQGIDIVLNIFFGVVVNAAMGIANQVKHAVENFTNNFIIALSPQITKSFASGDNSYLMTLIFQGSRYAYYLLFFLSLPIILETETVLQLWLKTVPEYAAIFVRLTLVVCIIESLSKTLIQAMFATGKIKNYQIVVGSITILNLPVSLLFLNWNFPPQTVFIIAIIIAIISLFVRLIMLKPMISLRVKSFLQKVVLNVISVSLLSALIPAFMLMSFDPGTKRFLLTGFTSVISTVFFIYFVGLQSKERIFIKSKIRNTINKLKNK
jgi:O-antigen/teichoic acid export membrane protein